MTDLVLLALVGPLLIAGVIVWRAGTNAAFRSDLVGFELQSHVD